MSLSQNVIAPEQALFENTPVFAKVECAVIQQGTVASVQWEVRDKHGKPIDLSTLETKPAPNTEHPDTFSTGTPETVIPNIVLDYYFEIIIQLADETPGYRWSTKAEIVNAKEGQIVFEVPLNVSDLGGLFLLNICLCRKLDQRPVYIQRGMLSVERSGWYTGNTCKMPTLNDIRMQIMDTPQENLLNNYVEFTSADILNSVASAVRTWNGLAPQVRALEYNCQTFPFTEPWLWYITASLYNKAALRYARVKLNINHGGIQGDDLARDKDYFQIAAMYEKKWNDWAAVKKADLNRDQFYGTARSYYGLLQNSQGYYR
jgi:hypothetical protein